MKTAKSGSIQARESKATGSSAPIVDGFSGLLPDNVIDAAEAALQIPFTGFSRPCASYVNRVYELEAADKNRYIAKFYRPGRWSAAAISEEHALVEAARADEIPVIAPLPLPGAQGQSVGRSVDGIPFAIYPRCWGRPMEITDADGWRRLGRLLGRLHNAADAVEFRHRWHFTPTAATRPALERLESSEVIARGSLREWRDCTAELMDKLEERFTDVRLTPVHGDCHAGNILERPDTGLMLIDFDDCMLAPAIQDWWLLLPDHADQCQEELSLLAEGYEDFRFFDWSERSLIEALRAMRMIYYLDWCSLQRHDFQFRQNHPDWGGENFWRRELADLQSQLELI